MLQKTILFLVIFFSCPIFAQQVRIEATVTGMPAGKIYLTRIKGDEHINIDSIIVSGEIFRFNLLNPIPGIYQITVGKTARANFYDERPQNFDLIIHNETLIKIKTSFLTPLDSMIIFSSDENEMFYKYLKLTLQYKKQGGALLSMYLVYDSHDPFIGSVNNEFAKIQTEYIENLINLSDKSPGSLASSYIKTSLIPRVDPSQGLEKMNDFLKEHYFDLVLLNDTRLIHSQLYTQKILEYLSFFRVPGITQSEQEDLYITAVDNIMERASYNEEVFEFILGYLIDGFYQSKMEKVLVHLALNYVEKGCETDSKKIMELRLDAYKKMAIGNKVNDIVLLDKDGETKRLSDLKSEFILVVFWSGECPHCTRLLPEIKDWYINERKSGLEVYSVSIDTSRFVWEANILANKYPWIDVCNFQGWEGKTTSDYNVYATPTMFLIDSNRKILAKPTTLREFRREVEKLMN